MLGILPLREAIEKAEDLGLDLVEVSPNAKPPVCKIIEYGKFKYAAQKKAAELMSKLDNPEARSELVDLQMVQPNPAPPTLLWAAAARPTGPRRPRRGRRAPAPLPV